MNGVDDLIKIHYGQIDILTSNLECLRRVIRFRDTSNLISKYEREISRLKACIEQLQLLKTS